MKKIKSAVLWMLVLNATLFSTAYAQEEELKISISRDWGYSSGMGDIQGTFSMRASGPTGLERVEFYIDDTLIAEDSEAPFGVQFNTDGYPNGSHSMYAVGYSSDGFEYRSKEIVANFVSGSEAWESAAKIIVPILGVILVVILISVVVPMISGRGKRKEVPLGAERNYGLRGGTICPKCKRPFMISVFGLNLFTHKYTCCPYCGKWSLVRSMPLDKLREAEKAELDWIKKEEPGVTIQDNLQKDLDESKYQDL